MIQVDFFSLPAVWDNRIKIITNGKQQWVKPATERKTQEFVQFLLEKTDAKLLGSYKLIQRDGDLQGRQILEMEFDDGIQRQIFAQFASRFFFPERNWTREKKGPTSLLFKTIPHTVFMANSLANRAIAKLKDRLEHCDEENCRLHELRPLDLRGLHLTELPREFPRLDLELPKPVGFNLDRALQIAQQIPQEPLAARRIYPAVD